MKSPSQTEWCPVRNYIELSQLLKRLKDDARRPQIVKITLDEVNIGPETELLRIPQLAAFYYVPPAGIDRRDNPTYDFQLQTGREAIHEMSVLTDFHPCPLREDGVMTVRPFTSRVLTPKNHGLYNPRLLKTLGLWNESFK